MIAAFTCLSYPLDAELRKGRDWAEKWVHSTNILLKVKKKKGRARGREGGKKEEKKEGRKEIRKEGNKERQRGKGEGFGLILEFSVR